MPRKRKWPAQVTHLVSGRAGPEPSAPDYRFSVPSLALASLLPPFSLRHQKQALGPSCWNPEGVKSKNPSSKSGWVDDLGNMVQPWKYGWQNSNSGNLHYRSPNLRMWTEYRIWPLVQLNLWNNHMLLFILYLAVLEEKNNIHLRKTLVTANLLATLFPLAFLEETKWKSSCTN